MIYPPFFTRMRDFIFTLIFKNLSVYLCLRVTPDVENMHLREGSMHPFIRISFSHPRYR